MREDAHLLFGFATQDERAAFRQLIKVTGIGLKVALAVLWPRSPSSTRPSRCRTSSASPACPASATRRPSVCCSNSKVCRRLRCAGAAPSLQVRLDDVVNALLALGYSEKEVAAACRDRPPTCRLNDAIRAALKLLSKAKVGSASTVRRECLIASRRKSPEARMRAFALRH